MPPEKATDGWSGGVAVEVLGAGEIKEPKSQGLEEADEIAVPLLRLADAEREGTPSPTLIRLTEGHMKIPGPEQGTNCEPTIGLVVPLLSNPVRIARV
jgi:hypothetical protein